MTRIPRSIWWTVVVVAVVFVVWGAFVLGFLDEPSAIGRMRAALIGIGVGSIVVGVVGAAAGVWMLVRRRS
jgi:hypothetical protein